MQAQDDASLSGSRPAPSARIRTATLDDLSVLLDLENRVFATDRISRRSLRHFITSPTAAVLVADDAGAIVGSAILLFRPRSPTARLYSIAVAPDHGGRGIGTMLLAAAETTAAGRDCRSVRLEVHVANAGAISRYRKCGYREFGRRTAYYQDGGDALRFEKPLEPSRPPAPSAASLG